MIYMNFSSSGNFGLLAATGSAAAGGLLYGGAYAGSKGLMNRKLSPDEFKQELVGNTVGGALSGAGLYGLSKLARKGR